MSRAASRLKRGAILNFKSERAAALNFNAMASAALNFKRTVALNSEPKCASALNFKSKQNAPLNFTAKRSSVLNFNRAPLNFRSRCDGFYRVALMHEAYDVTGISEKNFISRCKILKADVKNLAVSAKNFKFCGVTRACLDLKDIALARRSCSAAVLSDEILSSRDKNFKACSKRGGVKFLKSVPKFEGKQKEGCDAKHR
nr:hypothetical protein [uncultured Campylobacter sp.]